jgi:hypothetical protein
MSGDRPTEQEIERAKLDGESARRAGIMRKVSPWHFGGSRSGILDDAWTEGWEREDARRKAGVR